MRETEFPTGRTGPNPTYSTDVTLAVTALVPVAVLAALLAVAAPVAAATVVALAVAAGLAVRSVARLRRREGRGRRICVPNTDVCVEA